MTVTGSVTLALGGADALLAADFEFGDRAYVVTSDGSVRLDITAVTEPLGNNVSFALPADVTLRLTADQADGLSVTGDGNVIVEGVSGAITWPVLRQPERSRSLAPMGMTSSMPVP